MGFSIYDIPLVGTAVETVEGIGELIEVYKEDPECVSNAFIKTCAGYDFEDKLIAEIPESREIQHELYDIGMNGIKECKEVVKNAIQRINNISGFTTFYGTLDTAAYDEELSAYRKYAIEISTNLEQTLDAIERFNDASEIQHLLSTCGTLSLKTAEGIAKIPETVFDTGALIVGTGVNIFNKDAGNAIKKFAGVSVVDKLKNVEIGGWSFQLAYDCYDYYGGARSDAGLAQMAEAMGGFAGFSGACKVLSSLTKGLKAGNILHTIGQSGKLNMATVAGTTSFGATAENLISENGDISYEELWKKAGADATVSAAEAALMYELFEKARQLDLKSGRAEKAALKEVETAKEAYAKREAELIEKYGADGNYMNDSKLIKYADDIFKAETNLSNIQAEMKSLSNLETAKDGMKDAKKALNSEKDLLKEYEDGLKEYADYKDVDIDSTTAANENAKLKLNEASLESEQTFHDDLVAKRKSISDKLLNDKLTAEERTTLNKELNDVNMSLSESDVKISQYNNAIEESKGILDKFDGKTKYDYYKEMVDYEKVQTSTPDELKKYYSDEIKEYADKAKEYADYKDVDIDTKTAAGETYKMEQNENLLKNEQADFDDMTARRNEIKDKLLNDGKLTAEERATLNKELDTLNNDINTSSGKISKYNEAIEESRLKIEQYEGKIKYDYYNDLAENYVSDKIDLNSPRSQYTRAKSAYNDLYKNTSYYSGYEDSSFFGHDVKAATTPVKINQFVSASKTLSNNQNLDINSNLSDKINSVKPSNLNTKPKKEYNFQYTPPQEQQDEEIHTPPQDNPSNQNTGGGNSENGNFDNYNYNYNNGNGNNNDIPKTTSPEEPKEEIIDNPTTGEEENTVVPTQPLENNNPSVDNNQPSNQPTENNQYTPTYTDNGYTPHTGGGYSKSSGYTPQSNSDLISTPGVDKSKIRTSIDDIIKGNKYTKIPTTSNPITNNNKSDGVGQTIIPIATGLATAAAAGIGAKAYIDRRKNNDNSSDVYDMNGEDDDFISEDWNEDEGKIILDENETEQEEYLDDEYDYSYDEAPEKYGARTNEELEDMQ